MPITTAMSDSFKVELLSGAHCFNAQVTPNFTVASGATAVTVVSSMAGVAVGMSVTSASGLAANTYVAAITSATTLTIAPATTAALATQAVTITGDVFKMALIKAPSSVTYTNINSTNYSVVTGGADEVANGSGYSTTGYSMLNQSPIYGGSPVQGIVNFSPNPSWTSATFSTIGCMIYNTTDRLAGVTGRACGVFDFGGTQTVSNGTFTVVMPNFSSASAILRIA